MNITKRESAYRIRVFCGKDEKGISKFAYQTVRFDDPRFEGLTEKKRDKAAEAIGFEFEQQINSLAVLPNITFKAFAEKWFKDYADIQQATTTRERCEDFKERTYAALGDMRMDKIKTIHIQDFINSRKQDRSEQRTFGKDYQALPFFYFGNFRLRHTD